MSFWGGMLVFGSWRGYGVPQQVGTLTSTQTSTSISAHQYNAINIKTSTHQHTDISILLLQAGMISETGICNMPPELRPTSQMLSSDSVLLVDNGRQFVIRIGRECPSNVLQDLFGISSLENVQSSNVWIVRQDIRKSEWCFMRHFDV